MKLGITGSRTIRNFDFSCLFSKQEASFRTFLGRRRVTRIICGGAQGIDMLAEQSAKSMDIPVTVFLPDYRRYHLGAPLKRNEQIVDACDALLAVWNGKKSSKGTIYTIQYALSTGKPVFLIKAGKSKTTVVGNIASWD